MNKQETASTEAKRENLTSRFELTKETEEMLAIIKEISRLHYRFSGLECGVSVANLDECEELPKQNEDLNKYTAALWKSVFVQIQITFRDSNGTKI